MRRASPARLQSAINVTPLVDVVLVLLIIFMVIAPQLQADSSVTLPTTERPPKRPDDDRQILVAIEHEGAIRVDGERTSADRLEASMRRVAERRPDGQVVIKADARLTFGEVQRAMLAVEAAGFHDVGLIARQRDETAGEE